MLPDGRFRWKGRKRKREQGRMEIIKRKNKRRVKSEKDEKTIYRTQRGERKDGEFGKREKEGRGYGGGEKDREGKAAISCRFEGGSLPPYRRPIFLARSPDKTSIALSLSPPSLLSLALSSLPLSLLKANLCGKLAGSMPGTDRPDFQSSQAVCVRICLEGRGENRPGPVA